jgi:hypothetical protein
MTLNWRHSMLRCIICNKPVPEHVTNNVSEHLPHMMPSDAIWLLCIQCRERVMAIMMNNRGRQMEA